MYKVLELKLWSFISEMATSSKGNNMYMYTHIHIYVHTYVYSTVMRSAVPIVLTSFTNIIPGNSAKCSVRAARSAPSRL